jgi:hypothetical protein
MIIKRLLSISAVIIVLFSANAVAVQAQDAPVSRGTVKVRPRFFNPFDTGTSRLTLNPFGVFSFAQPTSLSVPLAVATTSSAKNDPVLTEGSLGVSTSAPRPPFRPPVRSPFRPPPRPPF